MHRPYRIIIVFTFLLLFIPGGVAQANDASEAVLMPTITIGFEAASSTATETDSNAIAVVVLIEGGPVTGDYSVDIVVNDITATGGEDYIALEETTIEVNCSPLCPNGSYSDNALELIDDDIAEGTEQVEFIVSNPQGEGLQLGEFTTHLLTILDNEVGRISPAHDTVLEEGPEWPDFTFEPLEGIMWYRVWIGPADYSTTDLFEWYPATDGSVGANPGDGICVADVCTIPTDLWLLDDDYEWWITYWSPDFPDYNAYWHESTFSVQFGTIDTIMNRAPEGNVAEATSLTWDNDPAVLWYQVWLGTADYSEEYVFEWYEASDICDEGVCTVQIETALMAGDYEWWMEVWGPGEYDDWFINGDVDFTLSSAS